MVVTAIIVVWKDSIHGAVVGRGFAVDFVSLVVYINFEDYIIKVLVVSNLVLCMHGMDLNYFYIWKVVLVILLFDLYMLTMDYHSFYISNMGLVDLCTWKVNFNNHYIYFMDKAG